MLQSGDIISGMYQVIREIGTGGMGVIYIGYHLHLQKQIVIKKIKETCVNRVNVRGEADILKQLRHTYLPQVYDFLEVGNDVYTVMDYIPGENLQYYIDHNYTFPEETILLWMRELCEVLDYLHTRKPRILHSDIKPANIMVTPEGDICLIDFNISLDGSVTQEVQGLSRRYASPEQFRCAMDKMYGRKSSETLDERMDIYSLGAVFYRMMSGYLPDAQNGVPYALSQIDIPYADGLKRIVDKAMDRDVSRRFSDGKTDGRSSFAYGKIRSEVPPSDELADIDRDCVGILYSGRNLSYCVRCASAGERAVAAGISRVLRRCGIRGFRKYNKRRNRTSEQFFFARLYEKE